MAAVAARDCPGDESGESRAGLMLLLPQVPWLGNFARLAQFARTRNDQSVPFFFGFGRLFCVACGL